MTRAWAIPLAGLLLAGGCGESASSTPGARPAAPARHVFVIVMENRAPVEVLQGAYIASLAATYGVAENYHAVAHPSVPNYLALTSGSTWGVTDDSFHILPQLDLGTQLTAAGVSWKAYMEGLTDAGCLESRLPYDPGHNPFAYYGGRCPANVVPLTSLPGDLDSKPPLFAWISPDRCHDMHDCTVAAGDAWLSHEVPMIMASQAWKSNGVLFITWDEDDGSGDNSVLTLVVAAGTRHAVSRRAYTHYSLLATVEDLLGVSRLGQAMQAAPMTDLVPGS